MAYTYTNQRELRAAFWADHPHLLRRTGGHNAQLCDTRMTFCDWIEALNRSGQISDALAQRVTL